VSDSVQEEIVQQIVAIIAAKKKRDPATVPRISSSRWRTFDVVVPDRGGDHDEVGRRHRRHAASR
jgi:hypothetical protein